MNILLAADGSKYTKKALAFLVTHESLCGPDDELYVLNVQPPVPVRVKSMLGANVVNDYYREEAREVLDPIERFLKRHDVQFRTATVVGPPYEGDSRRREAPEVTSDRHGHAWPWPDRACPDGQRRTAGGDRVRRACVAGEVIRSYPCVSSSLAPQTACAPGFQWQGLLQPGA